MNWLTWPGRFGLLDLAFHNVYVLCGDEPGPEEGRRESSAPEQHCFNFTLDFEVGLT